MDIKGILKAVTLDLRHVLEGSYDAQGNPQAGDLERRLTALGVRRDRGSVPVDELPYLAPEDREARRIVDAFLDSRSGAGERREEAITEFVREAAYVWANRLLALRCMEARGLIDEIILQKDAYGGRSLQHNRFARKQPERCTGEDEGLFAVLFDEFQQRAQELPLLFNPSAPEVALRPSIAALKRCINVLSGAVAVKGQDPATDEVFTAPDTLGWTYQYWNTEEKDRVFERVRTKKGAKIEGAEIIPATCIYTEPYIVRFLVQNSLGAIWMGMYPDSRLCESWEYYVRNADRLPVAKRPVAELTFLDPACGSGHFLTQAFDLFYAMYLEEGVITEPAAICASILERNLYGIDIDERAIQIAAIALVMKAKEKALDFVPRRVNLVPANIHLPTKRERLDAFLGKHADDAQLKPALLVIFETLAHADELGSLLQIEEPVEKELRALQTKYEAAGSPAEQTALWREMQKAVQGKLPVGVESYEAWKERTLARIREHFEADAAASDLSVALFGEAGVKGVSLLEVVSRRYDVVAANPPYMGSKNMGPVLKKHVERYFAAGKRDLYAAFILRCIQLAAAAGHVAMVTQQSWMFLRSFANLRALEEETREKWPKLFGGVLRETTIEAVAHLGPRAFGEISGEVVNSVMFILARTEMRPEHRITALRLVGPKSPQEKDALLRDSVRSLRESGSGAEREAEGVGHSANRSERLHPIVSRPLQARFLTIPQAPLCYWLRERFFELLAGRNLGDVADVCQGLVTGNEPRFTRFTWEAGSGEWGGGGARKHRWVPFEKGGGYGKWFGHHFWVVDWQHDGARIKATPGPRVQNEHHYFEAGWTYSYMASGSVGLRVIGEGTITCDLSAGVFLRKSLSSLGAVLNGRLSSYIVRSITPKIQLRESYVSRIPLPESVPSELASGEAACIRLKRYLVGLDPIERSFAGVAVVGPTLVEAWRSLANTTDVVAAVLHTLEGLSEREVFAGYGIEGEDVKTVVAETGTPAGWFPLVGGYDTLPAPNGFDVSAELFATLSRSPRRKLPAEELASLKRRLRTLYGAGPGAKADDDIETSEERGDDDEEEAAASGARIPIPAETFLEELSQNLDIHPISLYWLLRELREKEGVVCTPELLRFAEDYMSIVVLRLLGHRWPSEIETGHAAPSWADGDGIIPITDNTGVSTLLARVRQRIAEDFGAERAGAVEREFDEIVGKPLSAWLASDFFKRHISQFRKRPIAWQLISSASDGDRRRGRVAGNAPAFSCLVYYHRLNADLLPKLRTQYIGPLRMSFQTELGSLERMKDRNADQDARRLELENKLEELREFDARLERVIVESFASPALDNATSKETVDKWTSRDGRVRAPQTRDAFLAQERRYDPDLNDGVRVNIAPFQRTGLLAADVLAAKDIEKAIADRAEWRADERRWCREGKLPRPGWWPGEDHVS